MVSGLGYALYALSLGFYILFLWESDRLARECRPSEPASHPPGASWLTLWREHRALFPESDLRRRLALQVVMMCVLVAGGTLLAHAG